MMRILDVAGWSGSGAGAGMVDWEDMSAISCTFELVTIRQVLSMESPLKGTATPSQAAGA